MGKNDPANVIKTVNNDRIKIKTRRIPPECNNKENEAPESFYTSTLDNSEIVKCLLALTDKESCFLPFEHEGFNHLDLESIKEEQQEDAELQALAEKQPNEYFPMLMGGNLNILVYVKPGLDKQTQWKVCLPQTMVKDAVKWYHVALGHPGSARTRATMQSRYHSRHIGKECKAFKCAHCKKYKADPKQWGLLPKREVTTEPFSEIAVDLIGPWKIPV